jgi:hypothetical protein
MFMSLLVSFPRNTNGMYFMPGLFKFVLVKVAGELLFLYGLLGWIYGVLVQLTHPYWLSLGLSHLTPWIRTDTFTVISFAVSAVGFLMWSLARELANTARK